MPKATNENIGEIKHKLNYIGLNLDKIPKQFKEYEYLDFRPSKNYEEDLYKVYKHIPIDRIQILLTPAGRTDSLVEKYSKASPLYDYLVPEDDDSILKHTTFLKMLKDLNIEKIENIEKEQEMFNKKMPFKIKYEDNYLWQIYYSENTDQYFMLVSTKEQENSAFFYLLKKQIENKKRKKVETIYAPIGNLEISRENLTREEISDIEKYLWLFTKDWPNIYEVYDNKDEISIQIVGNADVYEKIKSFYKIELKDKEELTKFYKLIKALFILQTELPQYYKFEVKISSNGGLDFLYNTKIINFENLSKMIQEEYESTYEKIKILDKEEKKIKEELNALKAISMQKDNEYLQKEKQISTFLECKKSFIGKVKFFFKGKKKIKINNEVDIPVSNEKNTEEVVDMELKEYYTIEELLKIYKRYSSLDTSVKGMGLDIDALKKRIEIVDRKIQNADTYINEIEEHKKSIFEFWKFANKDDALALNAGIEKSEENTNIKLSKTFDYEEDIEEFGTRVDKIQRNTLSKEECDSIYLASFEDILKDINSIKLDNKEDIGETLEKIKQEAEKEEILFNSQEFDIFGGMSEDKTKISILNNQKHREAKKNKFKLLDITRKTTKEEYKDSLVNVLKRLNEGFGKIKLDTDIYVYMASDGSINGKEFGVFNINPENALKKCNNTDKINLYRINLKENMPILAFSNITYYDNLNRTLPVGMNMNDEILLDMNEFSFELKRQKLFRINQSEDEINVENKIVCVYEYDVEEVE